MLSLESISFIDENGSVSNRALMSVQAIACTTPSQANAWFCCWVVATNARKMRTSDWLSDTGKIGNGEKTMRSRPHDIAMAELYRNDPAFAIGVINDILKDGEQAELLTILRHMTLAFGGVQAVAEQAHLNPTQLYRTLSPTGNPSLSSLSAILKAMGLRLSVQASHESSHADAH